MSQQGALNTALVPVSVLETLTGDTGGAVSPDAAHNIYLLGGTGITTTGSPGTNTITIASANAGTGTGQTIGAVTADLITIALGAVATTYTIEARVAGFESTTPAGIGYLIVAAVRTTGAAASVVGTPEVTAFEDAALGAGLGTIVASGNNAIVRVTGVGGLTINWRASSIYTKVA